MSKELVSTDHAAPPGGPYSQAIIAGDFVFSAGVTPTRSDGSLERGAFRRQATCALANLEAIVERAGVTLRDAVKVNVYLKDFENFSAMNEIFEQYFGDSRPARTTVPADLAGFEVELDATFYREPS